MGSKKEQVGRYCPYCGAMITYDEYFCRACHTRLKYPHDLDAPSSLTPETYVVEIRKTWLSALFSVFAAGTGQFYNGDTLKGLTFFFAFLSVSFGYIETEYRTALYFGIWGAAVVEALWSAQRINHYKRPFAGTSYLLYAMLVFLALIVWLHLYTGLPDMEYLRKFFPVMELAAMR
jgi:TM2 domain-containing membrane protein YozV